MLVPSGDKEEAMPMILVSPKFTQEQYEETVRKLTGGKTRLEISSRLARRRVARAHRGTR